VSARAANEFEDVRLRHDVDELRARAPRSRLLRASLVALALLAAYAWLSGDVAWDDLFSARRAQNLQRFLTVDVRPYPLRGGPLTWDGWWAWAGKLLSERGLAGALTTLEMSVLAITLAGLTALVWTALAARNLATARPFEEGLAARPDAGGRPRPRGRRWRLVTGAVRGFLIFLRAIPEYVWAYLLLAMLGASVWPAVLALAIHNSGILGKLGAETVENLDPRPLRALRQLGASRWQIAAAAVWPASLSRFLLYFFYRFETCVREATVLGLLGVVSLGYWIQDARSKQFYDEMVFFVALGAALVLAADLASAAVRRVVRAAR
jgi:phosphonate transport system permease protein